MDQIRAGRGRRPLGSLAVGLPRHLEPTEQSPEIAVGTPACPDRFCSLDKTATGKTDRWILTGNYQSGDWTATAYAQRYDWNMLSDPTYDYQIQQFDHRWTVGGKTQREFFRGQPSN